MVSDAKASNATASDAMAADPMATGTAAAGAAPTDAKDPVLVLTTHDRPLGVPVAVDNWKRRRDALVVKQGLDYSCGAASLATLLNSYFQQDVTEAALLQAMNKGDGKASFDDMARALPQFGFQAHGFASSWEQLVQLKIPVIVYVKHRKNDHFAVLRGISSDAVWLADPSLGNRTYSSAQFLALWKTRLDADNNGLEGKFLAVLPIDPNAPNNPQFFSKSPRRPSAIGLHQLSLVTRP